jgi:hypothetical protein
VIVLKILEANELTHKLHTKKIGTIPLKNTLGRKKSKHTDLISMYVIENFLSEFMPNHEQRQIK